METEPSKQSGPTCVWPIVIAVVVYGLLMGLRGEFSSMGVRVAVASCAGAVLGYGIIMASQRKEP